MKGFTKIDYPSYINRVFHLTVVLLYGILIGTILMVPYKFPNIFTHRIIKHGWQYRNYLFSIWATAVQFAYFTMFVAIDILEMHGGPLALKIMGKLQNVASYLLFTFVFPLSIHVFILFWCIYAWDREYIYPKMLDQVAPFWLNHVFHSFPPALAVIYMYTCNKNEPSKKSTLIGLATLLIVYSTIFIYIKAVYGVWVYQAFEMFSEPFCKFMLLYCALGSIPFLFLGHKINKILLDFKQRGIFNFTVDTRNVHEKAM